MKTKTEKTRVADRAYICIERMIATLELEPGQLIVDAELVESTGFGRTPVREALMKLVSDGLIIQEPRRGMRVSEIDVAEHLTLIETRRALEILIAKGAARLATPKQREEILKHANEMVEAAHQKDINSYMQADQNLDAVVHDACRNVFAANAVAPLAIKCRRFWYAFQYDGDLLKGAESHLHLATGIVNGSEEEAAQGANLLMDYLEAFTRKIID